MNQLEKIKIAEDRKKELYGQCEELLAQECYDDEELLARYNNNLKEFVTLHREIAEMEEKIGWKLFKFLNNDHEA